MVNCLVYPIIGGVYWAASRLMVLVNRATADWRRWQAKLEPSFPGGVKMTSLICTVVTLPIAYIAYKESRKRKEAGKRKDAIFLMTVSVIVLWGFPCKPQDVVVW